MFVTHLLFRISESSNKRPLINNISNIILSVSASDQENRLSALFSMADADSSSAIILAILFFNVVCFLLAYKALFHFDFAHSIALFLAIHSFASRLHFGHSFMSGSMSLSNVSVFLFMLISLS